MRPLRRNAGLPRVSRAETVVRQIEQEVVEDGLPAGRRLGTKEELRVRFGVAAATINEALRVLETRGVVDARPGPGGGVFVAGTRARVHFSHLVLGFDANDAPFSDCLIVRNALEPLVCVDAAHACRPADAKALRSLVGKMSKALGDPGGFLHLNWQLHRRMAKMSPNALLKTLYLTLLDFVEESLQDVEPDATWDPAESLEIHRELVEAVVDGDEKRLRLAIARHTPVVDRWRERTT